MNPIDHPTKPHKVSCSNQLSFEQRLANPSDGAPRIQVQVQARALEDQVKDRVELDQQEDDEQQEVAITPNTTRSMILRRLANTLVISR